MIAIRTYPNRAPPSDQDSQMRALRLPAAAKHPPRVGRSVASAEVLLGKKHHLSQGNARSEKGGKNNGMNAV